MVPSSSAPAPRGFEDLFLPSSGGGGGCCFALASALPFNHSHPRGHHSTPSKERTFLHRTHYIMTRPLSRLSSFVPTPKTNICLLATFVCLALFLTVSPVQIESKLIEADIQKSPDPEAMDQRPGPHSTVYVPPPSAPVADLEKQSPSVRASRVKRQHVHDNSGFSIRVLIELVFCFFLPPAAVALHGGPHFQMHILLNVVLCVLGWIPGILHAIWYCFMSGF